MPKIYAALITNVIHLLATHRDLRPNGKSLIISYLRTDRIRRGRYTTE